LLRALPPAVTDALRSTRLRYGPGDLSDSEYLPNGWPTERSAPAGWNHESVSATQLAAWMELVERVKPPHILSPVTGLDGLPSPSDRAAHNTLMVFGYVLGRAAVGRETVSMLDWGGGLGQYAVHARSLFPELKLDYHCRELPNMVRTGREVNPDATFYDDDAPALARAYDLVMASGSLQYIAGWQDTLAKLAGVANSFLYVTRVPILERSPSFVVLQRPRRRGYQTAYPGWFLNRHELLDATTRLGIRLEREFLIWESAAVKGAPEQADYRGFLFAR
jgi:putative methyltransferase (TIGR04325 family)